MESEQNPNITSNSEEGEILYQEETLESPISLVKPLSDSEREASQTLKETSLADARRDVETALNPDKEQDRVSVKLLEDARLSLSVALRKLDELSRYLGGNQRIPGGQLSFRMEQALLPIREAATRAIGFEDADGELEKALRMALKRLDAPVANTYPSDVHNNLKIVQSSLDTVIQSAFPRSDH